MVFGPCGSTYATPNDDEKPKRMDTDHISNTSRHRDFYYVPMKHKSKEIFWKLEI